ncbi:hypothetical protein QBC32DRAFT_354248 [Pseudoneurospora amorphoporcata]|uniref:Uncharacterized protein n=1 Tax=Pseudoneurospora amorphoporcata TaxID=241081 RepID=A0AAN6SBV1_9PEZI|nr:hypothetical protein QBC32DRAFT_354248 [Pseudoneurospora amorphoporcata]
MCQAARWSSITLVSVGMLVVLGHWYTGKLVLDNGWNNLRCSFLPGKEPLGGESTGRRGLQNDEHHIASDWTRTCS